LLAVAAAPVLLYFLVHALSAQVLAQWPSAAYAVAVIAGVVAFAARRQVPRQGTLVRFGFVAAPWTGLAFTLVLLAQMTVRPLPVLAARDPLNIFAGWAQLVSDTRAVATAHHAGYILGADYDTTAELMFYQREIPVFQSSETIRYAFLPPIDQTLMAHNTGIYLTEPPFADLPEIEKHFKSVELVSTIWRGRDGDPIKPYRVYELNGYLGGVPY
jgi:hypothetical protein